MILSETLAVIADVLTDTLPGLTNMAESARGIAIQKGALVFTRQRRARTTICSPTNLNKQSGVITLAHALRAVRSSSPGLLAAGSGFVPGWLKNGIDGNETPD